MRVEPLTRLAVALFCAANAFGQAPDQSQGRDELRAAPGAREELPERAATARLAFRSEEAVLGEPVELLLEVTHGPDADLSFATIEPVPDPSWVVFESRRELPPEALQGRAGEERIARRVWTIASLEPGLRRAPQAFRQALEAVGVVLVGLEPVLDVAGVLAADEDQPRPLRGFPASLRPGGSDERSLSTWGIAALALVALGALGAWLLFRRRGARPSQVERPPLEELDRLRASSSQGRGDELREVHYALSRLVRTSTDRNLGTSRGGLTDEEWVGQTIQANGLSPQAAQALVDLFARFGSVKYGGELPTTWAVGETFDGARRVLELVGSASAPDGAASDPKAEYGERRA